MGADVDGDGPCRDHTHLRRFPQPDAPRRGRGSCPRAETAYLDPARKTDPEIPAVLAALLLLSAQLVVAGHLESLVQRLLICARVIDQPEVARVRENGVEILSPGLCPTHLERARAQVHHPLAKGGWLRATIPAV